MMRETQIGVSESYHKFSLAHDEAKTPKLTRHSLNCQ